MTHRLEAIFENGVFRPLEPVTGLDEQTQVRIHVEVPGKDGEDLADCAGILPDEDAAEMLRIIEAEFEQVIERDWQ